MQHSAQAFYFLSQGLLLATRIDESEFSQQITKDTKNWKLESPLFAPKQQHSLAPGASR